MTVDSFSLERPLFQFLTAFNGFNVGEVVWEKYQQFAIPKIENSTKELTEALYTISMLPPEEAKEGLNTIKKVIPLVGGLRKKLEAEEGEDFQQFKTATLRFFTQLDHVIFQLDKAANQNDNVRATFHHMTANRKNPAIGKHLK